MSTQQLVALAVTPVQRFIREARKAQDLWSSSLILSHMAVRMSRTLRDARRDGHFAAPRLRPTGRAGGAAPPQFDQ